MLLRRDVLRLAILAAAAPAGPALAQGASQASDFITQLGQQIVSILNGPGSREQKSAALIRIVNQDVDVDGVARFVLGRYWRIATPEQRQEYEQLFRKVLIMSITGRIGEYEGVRFAVGRTTARAEGEVVSTTITSPNKAPTQIDWVVRDVDGQPKIVDVIAEGTSLRITQRDDYASFIAQHGNSVQALIEALRRQVSQSA